jgi:hypothetical protein
MMTISQFFRDACCLHHQGSRRKIDTGSIPEGCNIQSSLVLEITVKPETSVLELLGYGKNGSNMS